MADRPRQTWSTPLRRQNLLGRLRGSRLAWRPVWPRPAVMRALRAVLVIPSVFRLDLRRASATCRWPCSPRSGGIRELDRSLVRRQAGGTRSWAHLGLALTGSIALIIGTAVSGIEWLAVLVTIPGRVRDLLRRSRRAQHGLRGQRRTIRLPAAGSHARHREHDPGPAGRLVAGLGRRDGGRAPALAAVARRPAARGGGRIGPRELAAHLEASVSGTPRPPLTAMRFQKARNEADEARFARHAVPADRAGNGRPGAG